MSESTVVNPEPSTEPSSEPSAARRWIRVAVIVVLSVLWVRVVLFAWLFPMIEIVDNPDFNDTETSAPVEPAG
ncbi:MAG: hypothetical protein ACI867_001545 [Glaciecola sp.]|jgi:hypothetical protein